VPQVDALVQKIFIQLFTSVKMKIFSWGIKMKEKTILIAVVGR
jgi:hypothetical protein